MDRRLRVLCVTPTGPSGRGGIDRLYRYLRESRLLEARADLAVRFFAARGPDLGRAWVALFPWRAALFVWAMARWRPHVVHINFATGGSLVRKYVLARLARDAFGAAVVVHFHGQFPLDDIARRTAAGRLFLALSRRADAVVALGAASERRFREAAGVPAARIRVVANGIPDFGPAPARAPGGPLRIAFAGEVGDRKGVPVLLAALALLPAGRRWTCEIAGDGDVERCAALARAAGIGDRVRFRGWTEAGAVHRMLAEADVVVLPSEAENMPLSLIEGACAGAALVATPVAETGEVVVDGVNGFLVARAPEAVAAALEALAAEPARLAAMQAASRARYLEAFTLGAMAGRLEAVYRSLAPRP